jgi:predicted nucleic acid-binding protein
LIVADASFVVEYLLKAEERPKIVEIVANAGSLFAPALIDFEVMSALRRFSLAKELSDKRAVLAIGIFNRTRILRYPGGQIASRIWELRKNVSAYDAAYLALAEQLDLPMHTFDRKLAKVPGHRAVIVTH